VKPLIAAAAALVVAAAAAVAFVLTRDADAGPDPFAGTYPLVTAAPTGSPTVTWRPTGRPAGPLPVFRGTKSKVAGRITDRVAGVSYARFGPPWHRPKLRNRGTSGAELIDGNKNGGPGTYWYVAVYSGQLPARFTSGATGPDALRAATELYGQNWAENLYSDQGKRTELAGQPLTVDGRKGWLTTFRMTHTDGTPRAQKSQTEVVVAVDTGRPVPAIVTVTVPDNKNQLLPDINTVVRSLHVIR
jgi:hypothetical protein